MKANAATLMNCPPMCLHTAEHWRHDVDIDEQGRVIIDHPIEFGDFVIATVRVDVRHGERIIETALEIVDVDSAECDLSQNPESLRRFAGAVLDAADWLEGRQAGRQGAADAS